MFIAKYIYDIDTWNKELQVVEKFSLDKILSKGAFVQ